MQSTYIINGVPANAGEFPFYCGLNTSDDANVTGHCCGAVLINKRWALTAAHCSKACGDKKVYVGLEHYEPNPIFKDKVSIEEIIVHPKWENPPTLPSGYDIPYDIALIKLARDTVSNDFAVVNGLDKEVDFPVGTEMIVTGCGLTENNQKSNILLKTTLLIADDEDCIKIPPGYPPTSFDNRIHICTRGLGTGMGGGDSGGPLMLEDKTVVGLTTRQFLNNTFEFTRVSYYRDWIQSIING